MGKILYDILKNDLNVTKILLLDASIDGNSYVKLQKDAKYSPYMKWDFQPTKDNKWVKDGDDKDARYRQILEINDL